MLQADLESAIDHKSESAAVDYKASFDPNSPSEWIEIVKDIVAFANSGGGVVVFGLADDGSASNFDCKTLEVLDPAMLTDKIHKYTGQQFSGFSFLSAARDGRLLFAIAVDGTTIPVVFSKPGTYDVGGGKQKTAFSGGTVYFRHGAKSEPGNADDLRIFIENRIEAMRKAWFEGIVKVVEAPPGSHVEVTPPGPLTASMDSVRLVNDPAAPAFRNVSVDESHPFRQKEVAAEVNKRLGGGKTVIPYHIQCVRKLYSIDDNPTFVYPMKNSSAQYSQAFVDWIMQKHTENNDFFEDARLRARAAKE
jgi:Putative DNA-binding domain/EC042_2821-lke REase